MKTAGIIAEYNPLHNGHIYHIQKTREVTGADVLVAVMSGNWTQRGEPAVTDKWIRADYAVKNGVDLVLELPYVFAVQNADRFAQGAVDTLKLAGVTDLVFGSECGELESLKEIAEISFDPNRFKENMDAGYSYPRSYDVFASQYGPNDILGVAYLKALEGSEITPHVIKRTVNYYSEEIAPLSSAYAIRKAVLKGQPVTGSTPMSDVLDHIPCWDDYYPYLRLLLMTSHSEELEDRLLVSEGIQNQLIKNAMVCKDYESFINASVSRRYTRSRIQRTLVHILAQTTWKDRDELPALNHIRILGYNETGRQYLKTLKKNKDLVIANKFVQVPKAYRQLEYKASAAYAYGFNEPKRQDMIEKEIYGMHK